MERQHRIVAETYAVSKFEQAVDDAAGIAAGDEDAWAILVLARDQGGAFRLRGECSCGGAANGSDDNSERGAAPGCRDAFGPKRFAELAHCPLDRSEERRVGK